MIINKLLTPVLLIFCISTLIAQQNCYQTFRNEGVTNFTQSNYQEAIANFDVANDREDKPENNDILNLIFNAPMI